MDISLILLKCMYIVIINLITYLLNRGLVMILNSNLFIYYLYLCIVRHHINLISYEISGLLTQS